MGSPLLETLTGTATVIGAKDAGMRAVAAIYHYVRTRIASRGWVLGQVCPLLQLRSVALALAPISLYSRSIIPGLSSAPTAFAVGASAFLDNRMER
ncbi:MAG: hypothetical protein HY675_07670 [Chloroflexi bacterium]|nr:hypothetical protein [Chloroflexota bacterium]